MEGFRSLSAAGSTLALLLTLSAALDSSVISLDVGVAEPDPDHGHRSPDEVWAMYESWLAREGKSHTSLGEKRMRFGVFADNLRFIDEHNGKADATYRLGLNRFADLTNEEYRRMYLGVKGGLSRRGGGRRFGEKYRVAKGEELPSEVDWRKEGAVAGVKDQGGCRSGWAFSTIAAVEGINKIETGNFITLSEQELLDCDQGFNQGCNGGRADYAYGFIINNGGIDTAEDYPYKGEVGKCDPARKHAKIVFIDQYEGIPVNEETSLKKAVANQPVSVIIEGAGRAFQLYESGIFTGECGTELDHGVTVVGYGTENGRDHWIVKNSWGERWGEGGYIRMDRNVADTETGKCGIAMEASYPVKTGQNQSGSRAFSSAI